MTTESEQNLIRLCHYEAFRAGLEWAVDAMPAEHRAIYLEQALSACLAVGLDRLPAETPAICRRVGLDVMLSKPAKPKPRRIVDWLQLQDAGSLWALASYVVLLLSCGAFVVARSIH